MEDIGLEVDGCRDRLAQHRPVEDDAISGRSRADDNWLRHVRPHPHIGLATVTYLFRGEFQHRDSLGSNQIILPGAVNWMVAGRGGHPLRANERRCPQGAAQPVRHPDLGRPA